VVVAEKQNPVWHPYAMGASGSAQIS